MGDDGLLKKAENALAKLSTNAASATNLTEIVQNDELSFDESSGISREEQKEILSLIEKVSKPSRQLANPRLWLVKARKRGYILPLLINIFAVIILIGGLLLLSSAFKQRTAAIDSGTGQLASAEGRLIKELQKEADEKLKVKDKELAAIQERLQALDLEKNKLASTMEDRIKAKETELAATLKSEIEKERERLIALGLSDIAVQERLKKFENEKKAEFDRVLSAFETKADAERKKMSDDFEKIRVEYKTSLSAVNSERQGILEDSRKREQDLRIQMDEKSKALEAERVKATAGLDQAKKELAALNDQLDKTRSAEDRLVGLYAAVRDAITESRFDDSTRTISALKAYIDDPSVSTLPNLQKRRAADLFVVDALNRLVETEKSKVSPSATSVAQSVALLASINSYIDEAKKSISKGEAAKAEEFYRLALASIPEIAEASAFFAKKDSEQERQRIANFEAAFIAMKTSFAAGDYQEALLRFETASAYFPISETERIALMERLKKSTLSSADRQKRIEDTKAAAATIDSARRAFEGKNYFEAILLYADLLAKYPQADQISQAFDGIKRNREAIKTRIDTLQEKLAEAELLRSADASELAAEKRRYAALAKELELAAKAGNSGTAPAAASPAAAAVDSAASIAEKEALKAEISLLKSQSSTIGEIALKYESLTRKYNEFAKAEDAILKGSGERAVIDARSRFDAFLGSKEALETMPDLGTRVKRYEQAFQAAGQKDVIYNAIDILSSLGNIPTTDARERYLDTIAKRYEKDLSMQDFIKTLRAKK